MKKPMKVHFYNDLEGFQESTIFPMGKHDFTSRWIDLEPRLELRPTDTVLDVGCAEGLISLEVARQVQSVRAMELERPRYEIAQKIKEKRCAENVSFECASILDAELPEKAYDVSLFLSVYQQLPRETRDHALRKILNATRRLAAVRTPLYEITKRHRRLAQIFGYARNLRKSLEAIASECGFTVEHYGPNHLVKDDSLSDHLFILKPKTNTPL